MCRIKTTLTKRIATKLFKENDGAFTNDFAQNKIKVSELAKIQSKKLRNIIAGYVTRLNKNKKTL